jgi:VIT1/CCC1 family predicted Fe2+/Mn2+ transporter
MRLDREELSAAIFGCFDGVVSIIGVVFALLLTHTYGPAIGTICLGGAISATVSMSAGEYESQSGAALHKLRNAIAMGVATLVGSMVPVWPFFVFDRTAALALGGIGAMVVATWIGREKRSGWRGYRNAYLILLGAAALTLLVVGLIPASA